MRSTQQTHEHIMPPAYSRLAKRTHDEDDAPDAMVVQMMLAVDIGRMLGTNQDRARPLVKRLKDGALELVDVQSHMHAEAMRRCKGAEYMRDMTTSFAFDICGDTMMMAQPQRESRGGLADVALMAHTLYHKITLSMSDYEKAHDTSQLMDRLSNADQEEDVIKAPIMLMLPHHERYEILKEIEKQYAPTALRLLHKIKHVVRELELLDYDIYMKAWQIVEKSEYYREVDADLMEALLKRHATFQLVEPPRMSKRPCSSSSGTSKATTTEVRFADIDTMVDALLQKYNAFMMLP